MKKNLAKPFLKWVGGKTQLLESFKKYFPPDLKNNNIKIYVEPFLGGGAVFFYLSQKYKFKKIYLYDINRELILAYRSIQKNVYKVIDILDNYSKTYATLDEDGREKFFYNIRKEYNLQRLKINYKKYSDSWVKRCAQLIFLNKTCFNGLFRMNKKGEFNVPFGGYKKPDIVNVENYEKVSRLLENVNIEVSDFSVIDNLKLDNAFVYFDPPYRPISNTSSFNSYGSTRFDDNEQFRLAESFKKLDSQGVNLLLSNSDPKNKNENDNFFENLYEDYKICKVTAKRSVNSKSTRRGKINELLIMNY